MIETAILLISVMGCIVVGFVWCCAKIGSDGNWYAEHMAESTPDNGSDK